jgi:hypothetical protein
MKKFFALILVLVLVLTGRNQNQNQNQQAGGEFQYNNSQAKELVTQLTGYIDLVSTPPVQTNSFGFGGLQQGMAARAEELKIYTPRLVITNIDAPGEGCELPVTNWTSVRIHSQNPPNPPKRKTDFPTAPTQPHFPESP